MAYFRFFFFAGRGQSYAAYTPYINGIYSMTVYVRGEILEGFPLDINIGDIRPRTRSAKKSFSGNGSKFGKLGDPHGVTVDKEGNVIVTDSRNHRIQVREFAGGMETRLSTHANSS